MAPRKRRHGHRVESPDQPPRNGRQGRGWRKVFESWEEMVGFLTSSHTTTTRVTAGPPKLRPRTRPWITLTPAYRRRLERAGIHRLQYEWGYKLSGARGHARTPEHKVVRTRRTRLQVYSDVEVMFVAAWVTGPIRRMGTPPLGPESPLTQPVSEEIQYRSLNYFLPMWWAWQEVYDEVMNWDEEDRDMVAYWIIESRGRQLR